MEYLSNIFKIDYIFLNFLNDYDYYKD